MTDKEKNVMLSLIIRQLKEFDITEEEYLERKKEIREYLFGVGNNIK